MDDTDEDDSDEEREDGATEDEVAGTDDEVVATDEDLLDGATELEGATEEGAEDEPASMLRLP